MSCFTRTTRFTERTSAFGPDGRFFEEDFVDGKLPVVVDSTHLFLPRATLTAHGEAYRFPLDWDVVLKYPNRSHGNAADFHLMQELQSWKPEPRVVTTDDILKTYPQFLVIEQRAWFLNLRATHHVTAEKLAEVVPSAEGDIACHALEGHPRRLRPFNPWPPHRFPPAQCAFIAAARQHFVNHF